MTDSPLVAGISGSRRDGSHTLSSVKRTLDECKTAGAETDLIDLSSVTLPLYHPEREPTESGDAAELTERVRAADAVIVGSPVYHGSYSSTFRNFHDYCSMDEYEDTVVGLIAVAGGSTIATTLDHLRVTMRGVHANVTPGQVGISNASNKFDADGSLMDADIADRLTSLAEDVVAEARLRQTPPVRTGVPSADD